MKVLVTGAGGFVGKRLVRLLADRGDNVVAIVHRAPSEAERALIHPDVAVRVMDLEAPDFAALPDDTEAVVALAQSQHFRGFPGRANEIFAVNVHAHLQLLEWARTSAVRRFVYASSGGVYGPRAPVDVPETQMHAVDEPLGFYLGSKLCGEVIFQNYRQFFDAAVTLRPFFIYGPGQRPDMLVPRIVTAVDKGKPIQLQGEDGLKFNPIYVDDAARAFAAALFVTGSHVMNLGGREAVTLRDLGNRIGRILGREPRFEKVDGVPSDYVGNIEVAKSLLGDPLTSLDAGLAYTLAAHNPHE